MSCPSGVRAVTFQLRSNAVVSSESDCATGRQPTADTNVARVAGTLCENAVSDLALELFGPDALEYGHAGDAYFRLAMTAGVAVGTTEINLNLIAGRMLDLPRE